jgi:hypothetical protein
MAYKVLKSFTDLSDGKHIYVVGDTFPREGAKVSPSRIHELLSNKNSHGQPLIQEAEELKTEKAVKKANPKPKRKTAK